MEGDVNWEKCLICGAKRFGEALRCIRSSRRHNEEEQLEVYAQIHRNIHLLWDKGVPLPSVSMPKTLTAKSMFDNSGKWHHYCQSRFSDSKVQLLLQSHQNKEPEPEPEPASQAPKRSRSNYDNQLCIFCQVVKQGVSGPETLHEVTTIEFGTKHRDMAAEIDDPILVLRMDRGDLIAAEAKYHRSCQTAYSNWYKKFKSQKISSKDREEQFLNERVYMELIDSIKNDCANGIKFFPMADLTKQYEDRKKQLNLPVYTHSTRLRERIVKDFGGDFTVQGNEGGPKTLVFGDGLNTLVKDALQSQSPTKDMQIIAQAAKIIREDIFQHEGFQFDSSFPENCHSIASPVKLLTLMSLMIFGPSIKDQQVDTQPVHTASQIVTFNAKKSSTKSKSFRHTRKREPPIPLRLGMFVYAKTRSKVLIDEMNAAGVSVDYRRVKQLDKDFASSVCEYHTLEGAVVPTGLKKNTFVVSAIDNIDVSARSLFGSGELHGTFITATQHPTEASIDRPEFKLSNQGYKVQLPEEFSTVDCMNSVNQKKSAPAMEIQAPYYNMEAEFAREQEWADVSHLFLWDELEDNSALSWAAFMANQNELPATKPAITGYFPIFEEKAASFPMLQHGMKVVSTMVEKLNPGQKPVLVADQPLFAILKQLQWINPQYSEDKFVVLMGGLHVEMCFWQNLGKLLDGSQWGDVLVEADVLTIELD